MFISKNDSSCLLILSSVYSCITLPPLFETLFQSVSSNSLRFSEFKSEKSSNSGDIGGVLYSFEIVQLLSECTGVGMSCCELSCCWCWIVFLLFCCGWLFVFVSDGVIVIMFACSILIFSRSDSIAVIFPLWSVVLFLVACDWLSKNTTVGVSCLVGSCLFALILTTALSIFGVDLYEINVCWLVGYSKPIGGLSCEVVMNSEGSFVAMMLGFMLESESMLNCFALSDWRMLAVSIVRNDWLASNCMLLRNAACLAPCWSSSPGDFFGVLVHSWSFIFQTNWSLFPVLLPVFLLVVSIFDSWWPLFSIYLQSTWCSFWTMMEWVPWSSVAWLLLNRTF